MFHSKWQSEDYQNDITFEESREDRRLNEKNCDDCADYQNDKELLTTPKKDGNKMLDWEFFEKIWDLTNKLHNVNKNKFTTPVKVQVIEKRIRTPEEKKENYYRYHRRPLQEWFRTI